MDKSKRGTHSVIVFHNKDISNVELDKRANSYRQIFSNFDKIFVISGESPQIVDHNAGVIYILGDEPRIITRDLEEK